MEPVYHDEPIQNVRREAVRLFVLRGVLAVVFFILIVRLWQLQFIEGERYRLQAAGNRLRIETIPAPRGVIYDREGHILVRNEATFDVLIVPGAVPEEAVDHVLTTVASLVDVPLTNEIALAQASATQPSNAPQPLDPECGEPGLKECFQVGATFAPYRPIIVKKDVDKDIAFQLKQEAPFLPGVFVESRARRHYLYGPLFSHLLGFVLPVNETFLAQASASDNYELNDEAGVSGVEASLERELRGKKGVRLVEKDVIGREVRVLDETPPEPGHNLFLTIDMDLQRYATEALRKGLEAVGSPRGAVVAIDPRDGQVLALVSLPSYDNNVFVGGISPSAYEQLLNDPRTPMLNMAVSAYGFPPGSIFKLVTAAAALQEGIITRETRLDAPGIIYLPNKYDPDNKELAQPFYDWLRSGHGRVNVIDALARSSDVFFYKVAGGFPGEIEGLGIEKLAQYAALFGLGQPTRIDLPGESAGLVPTPDWKRRTWGETWTTGDTYNMAIGQGFLTTTPLQMVNVTAAVANGGTLYRPQLVYQIQDADGNVVQGFTPDVIRKIPVDPEHLETVREGMLAVVQRSDGTARYAGLPTSVAIAGKTGTAEYCDPLPDLSDCKRNDEGNLVTHAWFVAFAPYENPEIALIVFVHGNGRDVLEGSKVAAPIAADILRYWFEVRPNRAAGAPFPVAAPAVEAGRAETTDEVVQTLLPPLQPENLSSTRPFKVQLVRTLPNQAELSVLRGTVRDVSGRPVANVRLVLTPEESDTPATYLMTDTNGTFYYDFLTPAISSVWRLSAPDLPGTPDLTLSIESSQQYVVEFTN